MDRGAWWAAVYGVAQSRTQLSDFTFTFPFHALEKEMALQCSCLENPRDKSLVTSSRDEGLLFLPGLESNPESSLQPEEEALHP